MINLMYNTYRQAVHFRGLKAGTMFFTYSFLYFMAMLVLLPLEYSRRPKELRQRWLKERLGLININSGLQPQNSKLIWIHAVSMGEVIASVLFVKELKTKHPLMRFVFSTVTDTGQKVARERISDIADVIYVPFDLVFAIRGLLKKIKPCVFIAMETELWPNTFRILNKNKIPILVMNGRLSEKSFNGYRKIYPFIKPVIRCVDVFCVQEQLYAERIEALGADKGKVTVTGNFKFDAKPPDKMPEWAGQLKKDSVIIAGSTHKTEEEMIIDVFQRLLPDFHGIKLIIAPRHPERFKEVEELIKGRGLEYIKRSEIKNSAFRIPHSTVVVLLDVVGELASVYGLCDIAIIGGSFIRHGGQNPLEPVFWGKPVVCGPYMDNFPFIRDFRENASIISTESGRLYDRLRELLQSPEKRRDMGLKARALYNEKAGAINRSIEVLEDYIDKSGGFCL